MQGYSGNHAALLWKPPILHPLAGFSKPIADFHAETAEITVNRKGSRRT
jgi:hypothetical protein